MEEEKPFHENVLEKVENKIKEFINTEDINKENVHYLYELEDIHKDIMNEKYWEEDKKMRYNEYGARMRDSRGRYAEYGRRGVPRNRARKI